MQAGSTFKPFGLIAALEQGIGTTPRSPATARRLPVGPGKDGEIHNFADEQFGSVDLQTATAFLSESARSTRWSGAAIGSHSIMLPPFSAINRRVKEPVGLS